MLGPAEVSGVETKVGTNILGMGVKPDDLAKQTGKARSALRGLRKICSTLSSVTAWNHAAMTPHVDAPSCPHGTV